ncbi:hypothetical protein Hypma_006956 [Hypsizygus marmoreus]|uniref:F-box domain-containing protein n=1 Tax=Hypsizygus marmoreus TaxID=39966 RepID=A0A369K3I2_HYPMA|nr:hypothetical protein Hypma_006956 [Hypsizygus marmoreus]
MLTTTDHGAFRMQVGPPFHFEEWPQTKGWLRFAEYSAYVRQITLPNMSDFDDVFEDMSRTRPAECSVIFPNLRVLRMDASFDKVNPYIVEPPLVDCAFFMVSSVRELRFAISSNDTMLTVMHRSVRHFFDSISQRMMNIRTFSMTIVQFNGFSPTFKELLVQTLACLKSLEHVYLPLRIIIGKVITSLSSLPQLQEIHSIYRGLSWESSSQSIASEFKPVLKDDESFTSLKTFSCCGCPSVINKYLLSNPMFPGMQISGIQIQVLTQRYRNGKLEPLHELMKAIAENCPNIEEFSVSESKRSDTSRDMVFSFSAIRPIFKCRYLTSLTIRFRSVLTWTAVDFMEFAASLPSARTLMLHFSHPLPGLLLAV